MLRAFFSPPPLLDRPLVHPTLSPLPPPAAQCRKRVENTQEASFSLPSAHLLFLQRGRKECNLPRPSLAAFSPKRGRGRGKVSRGLPRRDSQTRHHEKTDPGQFSPPPHSSFLTRGVSCHLQVGRPAFFPPCQVSTRLSLVLRSFILFSVAFPLCQTCESEKGNKNDY